MDFLTRQSLPMEAAYERAPRAWLYDLLTALGLSGLMLVIYTLPMLFGAPLTETPEARISVVAREMVKSGDYIVPMQSGKPRLNKPPLPYWAAAIATKIVPAGKTPLDHEHMARSTQLPAALMGALLIFVVTLYGCQVFSVTGGALAGLMLGTSAFVVSYSQTAQGDIYLTAFFTMALCACAAIVCNESPGFGWPVIMGVGLGLAILVKGHVPIALIFAPVVGEVIARKFAFNGRKVMLMVIGLAIALAIAAPWFYMVEQKVPDAWRTMGSEVEEGLAGKSHYQDDGMLYYLYRLPTGILPWAPLVLIAWLTYFQYGRRLTVEEKTTLPPESFGHIRFFLLAFIISFIGFMLVAKKQEYYLLPILPALMLATGGVLARCRFPGGLAEEFLGWSHLVIALLFGVVILSVPAWESIAQAFAKPGHTVSIPAINWVTWYISPFAAGLYIVLHLVCARAAVEGRIVWGYIALMLIAYVGFLGWSVYSTMQARKSHLLFAEATRLQAELSAFEGARIYFIGEPAPLVEHYLAVPVHGVDELAKEETGQTGSNAPVRVLIGTRQRIRDYQSKQRVEFAPSFGEGSDPQVVVLDRGIDWPEKLKAAAAAPKGPTGTPASPDQAPTPTPPAPPAPAPQQTSNAPTEPAPNPPAPAQAAPNPPAQATTNPPAQATPAPATSETPKAP